MKAEERKHLKENAFQAWVGRAWKSVTSGSTANTIVWSAILLGLVGIIGWRYYSNTAFAARSAAWLALDNATTLDDLKAIIAENKNSTVGRTARFHLTRYQIQDSLNRLAGPNLPERQAAADELTAARDAYRELANESREATLTQEAMMNVAKAEETLTGVPKADNDTERRGSLDQAVKLYQELASKYPNSFLGGQAAARAKQIEDNRSQVQAFYDALVKEHGKPAPPPPLPEPPKPESPPSSDPPKP